MCHHRGFCSRLQRRGDCDHPQCPSNDLQSAQVILPRSPEKADPMLSHILGGWFLQRLKVLQMKRDILWGP